jgi:prophage regulatory protein
MGAVMNNDDLIRVDEVRKMIGGVSRSTVYNWIRDNHFPRGAHIGERIVAWKRGQVRDWIDNRVNQAA